MTYLIIAVVSIIVLVAGLIFWRLFIRNYAPYEFHHEHAEYAFIFFSRRGIFALYWLHLVLLVLISIVLISYVY